jgi:ABC-2 type transport system permease protein
VTALFAAEISKLRTVRVTWILTLFGVLFVALSVSLILFGAFGEPFAGTAGEVADVVAAPGGNSIIVLVVALLSMTTEFRHGTIGRTLQLTPSRTAVLLAKMAAAAVYAVAFLALSLALVAILLVVAGARQGIGLDVSGPAYEAAWQGLVALVLTALLGVAFGALVRAQVVAVTVALVWVFAVEQLFVGLLPEVGRWLPFQALNGLFLSEAQAANAPPGTFIVHEPATALGVFFAWVVAFGLAAVVLMRRRDV